VSWIDGVGLRPEVIRVLRIPEPNGSRSRPAVVTGSVFLGDCIQVITRLATGEEAVAQIPRGQEQFQSGDAVHISWQAADEITFP
jgi:hypothetical protein